MVYSLIKFNSSSIKFKDSSLPFVCFYTLIQFYTILLLFHAVWIDLSISLKSAPCRPLITYENLMLVRSSNNNRSSMDAILTPRKTSIDILLIGRARATVSFDSFRLTNFDGGISICFKARFSRFLDYKKK